MALQLLVLGELLATGIMGTLQGRLVSTVMLTGKRQPEINTGDGSRKYLEVRGLHSEVDSLEEVPLGVAFTAEVARVGFGIRRGDLGGRSPFYREGTARRGRNTHRYLLSRGEVSRCCVEGDLAHGVILGRGRWEVVDILETRKRFHVVGINTQISVRTLLQGVAVEVTA